MRMKSFLLSDTNIPIKVKGVTEEIHFLGHVGIPQGDSLSPVLFIMYLEAALREIENLEMQRKTYNRKRHMPMMSTL